METEPNIPHRHGPALANMATAIRRLSHAVYQDTQDAGRSFGVTGPQADALRTIELYGPISSADLSRRLRMTPSNITGIIDRLEKKGLCERVRKPGDRRVLLLNLTEAGRRLGRRLPDPIEQRLRDALAGADDRTVSLLAENVAHLIAILDGAGLDGAGLDGAGLDGAGGDRTEDSANIRPTQPEKEAKR